MRYENNKIYSLSAGLLIRRFHVFLFVIQDSYFIS